jgi:L,D-peptidoglycan transpeptidase YkuD (ErfK/YbiS/YcfS/YnhG family)
MHQGLQHDGAISQSPPALGVQAYESLMGHPITKIRVSRCFPGLQPTDGFAQVGGVRISCKLGRSGIASRKREGDGATPRGEYTILEGYYRSDRLRRPRASVRLRATRQTDGWCDDPSSFHYNRAVKLPFAKRSERLSLEEQVYDIVLVTSHNTRPRTLGAGSAIFVHLQQRDRRPTQGCIAFAFEDLRRLLPRLSARPRLVIY